MKKTFLLFTLLALVVTLVACTDPIESDDPEIEDLVDTAIAAGDFETLVAALVETELDAALRGEGPFTVFAPNDDAFVALLSKTLTCT